MANDNAIAVRDTSDIALPDFGDTQFDAPPQAERRVVYWMNGSAQQKRAGGLAYFGGWCISAENANPDQLDPDVWELESVTSRNGKEFQVYTAPVVRVAMLGWRESWTQRKRDDQEKPTYQREYGDGLTSYVEVAAISDSVRGAIVLTAKGYNANQLKKAYSKAVTDLNIAFKKPVPPYAFYMALGGEVDEKKQPVFTLHGKGDQQSPIVHIVPRWTMDGAYLKQHLISDDVKAAAQEFVRVHLAAWKTERFQQIVTPATPDDAETPEPDWA